MRIISGKYKGRIIDAPKGLDVRPTTDRVREAMFSSIISLYGPLENTIILDAFAGSGALGFESISRGASSLISFENNKNTFNSLVKNSEIFNEYAEIKLINSDVTKANFKFFSNKKFNVLFFDPPYKFDAKIVLDILIKLKKANSIENNSIVVYEHSAKTNFDDYIEDFTNKNFTLQNVKIYGEVAIEYLKYI